MPKLPHHPRQAEIAKAFGKVVKAARLKRRLKQEALAYDTGVCTQTVSNWETGKAAPSFTALLLISDAVQTPLSKLFAATERVLHLEHILRSGGKIVPPRNQEDTNAPPPDPE